MPTIEAKNLVSIDWGTSIPTVKNKDNRYHVKLSDIYIIYKNKKVYYTDPHPTKGNPLFRDVDAIFNFASGAAKVDTNTLFKKK